MLWLVLACTPPAERFLVIDGRAGAYTLEERPIPELLDPGRMVGTLGEGSKGGAIRIVGGVLGIDESVVELYYEGGKPIFLDYTVSDGVAVPMDADGLTLWSYYHTLSRVSVEMGDLGVDVGPIFPIPFAWQPSMPFSVGGSENAAYAAGGLHRFILLADPPEARLPLGASPMVIRHEFGHALFQVLVHGDPHVVDATIRYPHVSDLNEGFADMVASLLLDDPDILGSVFDGPVASARRLDQPTTLTVDPGDPYVGGTTLAAFAWDLRLITDDPHTVLGLAIDAVQGWAEGEDLSAPKNDGGALLGRGAHRMLEGLLQVRPDAIGAACDAYRSRFAGFEGAPACGG